MLETELLDEDDPSSMPRPGSFFVSTLRSTDATIKPDLVWLEPSTPEERLGASEAGSELADVDE